MKNYLRFKLSLLRISWSMSEVSFITCRDFNLPGSSLWFPYLLMYYKYTLYDHILWNLCDLEFRLLNDCFGSAHFLSTEKLLKETYLQPNKFWSGSQTNPS